MFHLPWKARLPEPHEAGKGRPARPYAVPERHAVLGSALEGPFSDSLELGYFALGCFWGAERLFWTVPGVVSTAVGYAGGLTPHPTYEEVCTGRTGHAETVQVVFDPAQVAYGRLLRIFWEAHDPTQGFRQGNDVGTEYRSAIFATSAEQRHIAEASREEYGRRLSEAGHRQITTEICDAGPFYYAEEYHQQYLHKVPHGYCGLSGTGVSCPYVAPPATV